MECRAQVPIVQLRRRKEQKVKTIKGPLECMLRIVLRCVRALHKTNTRYVQAAQRVIFIVMVGEKIIKIIVADVV